MVACDEEHCYTDDEDYVEKDDTAEAFAPVLVD